MPVVLLYLQGAAAKGREDVWVGVVQSGVGGGVRWEASRSGGACRKARRKGLQAHSCERQGEKTKTWAWHLKIQAALLGKGLLAPAEPCKATSTHLQQH